MATVIYRLAFACLFSTSIAKNSPFSVGVRQRRKRSAAPSPPNLNKKIGAADAGARSRQIPQHQGYVDFAVGVLAVSKQPDAAPIVGGPGLATTHRRPRHDRNDFGDQGTGS
jgi:hypothetical protein